MARVLGTGTTYRAARAAIVKVLGTGGQVPKGAALTPRMQSIIGIASGFAAAQDRAVDERDLLIGLLAGGESVAISVLRQAGVDPAAVSRRLAASAP